MAPHMQVSPYAASTALRVRYGVTPKVQIGLTYLIAAVFDDPSTVQQKQAFHSGKAVGLDDFLNIKLNHFAPTFYQELQNATAANGTMTNTTQSAGELRVSLFGVYQYQPNLAVIGRTGIQMED